jgi:hypothetical protein
MYKDIVLKKNNTMDTIFFYSFNLAPLIFPNNGKQEDDKKAWEQHLICIHNVLQVISRVRPIMIKLLQL